MLGLNGKILRVDLTNHTIVQEEIKESLYKTYLGGSGLGTYILYNEVGSDVSPFDPENRLILAVGPYQATGIPGSGRWTAIGKSPLTGIYCDAGAGGYWGPEFKKSGFDAIIFQGRSERPIYLFVNDGGAELKDAEYLWGRDLYEMEQTIKKDLGDEKIRVAGIGQGGENLVRISSILSDKGHGVAARGGLGAVMGSKRLKAVAVRGTLKIDVAEVERLREFNKIYSKSIARLSQELRRDGTAGYVPMAESLGDLPKKNWKLGDWSEYAEHISGQEYTKHFLISPKPCTDCPIGCHRYGRVLFKLFQHIAGVKESMGMGPEYESVGTLGSLTLVDDLRAVVEANDLCNRFGIDVIEVGNLVGFAMECYERGLITKEQTSLDLDWGNSEALVRLTEMIAFRKGLGGILADGIREASRRIGGEAEQLAMHVKGMSLPAHDPRAYYSLGLNYATSPRGACHLHGWPHGVFWGYLIPEVGISEKQDRYEVERAPYIVVKYQDWSTLHNSLIQCAYMTFGGRLTMTNQLELFNLVTGWNMNIESFIKIGDRIVTLQRQFNIKHGVKREDDTLPKRILTPFKDGGAAGKVPPLEPMLEEFYKIRGWDQQGHPTKDKLAQLNIKNFCIDHS